jgi:hypothetical protein
VVKRDNFKALPIPQDVIKRINDIVVQQKQFPSPSLTVTQGHDEHLIEDDEDAEPPQPAILRQLLWLLLWLLRINVMRMVFLFLFPKQYQQPPHD